MNVSNKYMYILISLVEFIEGGAYCFGVEWISCLMSQSTFKLLFWNVLCQFPKTFNWRMLNHIDLKLDTLIYFNVYIYAPHVNGKGQGHFDFVAVGVFVFYKHILLFWYGTLYMLYEYSLNKSALQHWVIIKTHCTKCFIISVWMVYEQVCIAALGYHKYSLYKCLIISVWMVYEQVCIAALSYHKDSLYKMFYHFSMDGVWTSLYCSVGLS